MYAENDWKDDSTDFVISSYGLDKVQFGKDESHLFKKSEILRKVFKSKAKKGHVKVKVEIPGISLKVNGIKRYTDVSGIDGYCFFFIDNTEKSNQYKEMTTFK